MNTGSRAAPPSTVARRLRSAGDASREGQKPLRIRISLQLKKRKHGPSFGNDYFRGKVDGFEGLDTSASLEELEMFVKANAVSKLRPPDDGSEYKIHGLYEDGVVYYSRSEKQLCRMPGKIETDPKTQKLFQIYDDDTLKKAIHEYGFHDKQKNEVLLDIVVTCKCFKKKKPAKTPAAGTKRSSSSTLNAADVTPNPKADTSTRSKNAKRKNERIADMGREIGESNVKAAKITARGQAGVPASCILQLKYEGTSYQYVVAEDDYDKTITTVLNEMRKQNLTSDFMAFDAETLADLKASKKEFVLWIHRKEAKIRCNKDYRDQKKILDFVNLLDSNDNKTIVGSIEIVDIVQVDASIADFVV